MDTTWTDTTREQAVSAPIPVHSSPTVSSGSLSQGNPQEVKTPNSSQDSLPVLFLPSPNGPEVGMQAARGAESSFFLNSMPRPLVSK